MAYRQVEVRERSQTSDSEVESLVGRRTHARRLELGLTQAEVAAGMLSPSYLSLVESGRRQPAPAALAHIAERLGVDPGYLLDGIDAEVRRRARLALGHAQVALHRGDIEDAYKRFVALKDDPGLSDEQQRQARMGRAIAAERKGDLEEALRVLGELADEARREPNVHPWMDLAESRGQIGEALTLVDRALALFGESDDRRNLARLRVCYAWLLLQQSPPEAEHALDLLDSVEQEIQTHGGAIDLGYYATERARALLALGRLDDARAAAMESLSRLGDQPRIESARARLLLGRILREQGLSDETLEQCSAAATMLEAMGASRQAAAAWRELGDLYRDLGRIDETLDAYDRALVAVRVSPVSGVGPTAAALELRV